MYHTPPYGGLDHNKWWRPSAPKADALLSKILDSSYSMFVPQFFAVFQRLQRLNATYGGVVATFGGAFYSNKAGVTGLELVASG